LGNSSLGAKLPRSVATRIKSAILLFLVATIASAHLLLAPEALFWDDWVLFNGGNSSEAASQLGRPWTGFLLNYLSSLGPWAYKLVSFASLFAGALLVQEILKLWPGLTRNSASLGAVVFLLAPVAYSRVFPSILTFHLSLTLFLLGWLILLRAQAPIVLHRRMRSITASGLIGISTATTASLGLLFLLPFLHLVLVHFPTYERHQLKPLLIRVAKLSPLWLSPIGAFLVSRLLFEPYGLYTDYNSFKFLDFQASESFLALGFLSSAVVAAGVLLLLVLNRGVRYTGAITFSLTIVLAYLFFHISDRRDRRHNVWQDLSLGELLDLDLVLLLVIFSVITFWAWLSRILFHVSENAAKTERYLVTHITIVFGQLGLALGMLPYLLVGKTPSPSAQDDRLELLLPIGLSWMVVGCYQVISDPSSRRTNQSWGPAVLAITGLTISVYIMIGAPPSVVGILGRVLPLAGLLIALSVAAVVFRRRRISGKSDLAGPLFASLVVLAILFGSLATSAAITADWRKQELVIQALMNEPDLSEFSTIIISDNYLDLNWDGRRNAIYEVTGWVRESFGSVGILGVSRQHTSFEQALTEGYLESPALQKYYGFSGWDKDGRVAEVALRTTSTFWEILRGTGEVSLELVSGS